MTTLLLAALWCIQVSSNNSTWATVGPTQNWNQAFGRMVLVGGSTNAMVAVGQITIATGSTMAVSNSTIVLSPTPADRQKIQNMGTSTHIPVIVK